MIVASDVGTQSYHDYHRERAAQERMRAELASHRDVQRLHLELARRHEELLEQSTRA